jgi:uncharacterized protein YggE
MRKINTLLLITLTALLTTACSQTTSPDSGIASPQTYNAESDTILNTASASPAQAFSSPSTAIEISGTSADNIVGYPENTIVVNSSEKVAVVPDIAEVVYSVRTENKDAATCQSNNNEAVSQVIGLLKELGIKETSIQTSDYYMHPIYNYSNNTTRVVGYEATTTLTVSDLPIEGLSDILTQSVSTGINTIQSITYQASKYDECYQEALTAAIATAHQKAEVMAVAADCTIGHVISIQETSGYSEARYTDYARVGQFNAAKEQALADSAADIMPGEIQVEAGIIVKYQLIPTSPIPQ